MTVSWTQHVIGRLSVLITKQWTTRRLVCENEWVNETLLMTSESVGVSSVCRLDLQPSVNLRRSMVACSWRRHVTRNTVTLTTCHVTELVSGVSMVSWCDCLSSEEHEHQDFFSVRPAVGTEGGPVHNIPGSVGIRVLGSRTWWAWD